MTAYRHLLTAIVFTFISMSLLGQTRLSYLTSSKLTKDFEISSKSNSFNIKDGKTKTMKVKIKKGTYYYVSVNKKYSNKDIHYRISENGKLVYDNSLFEFDKESVLLCTENTILTIEIVLSPDVYQRKGTKPNCIKFVLATKKNRA